MSVLEPSISGTAGPGHPVVLDRRMRDLVVGVLGGVVLPGGLALGLTLSFPKLSLVVVLAILAGVIAIVALMKSPDLGRNVYMIGVYLLVLNGPVKLGIGAHEATAAIPDILIGAVCLGALLRMAAKREKLRSPPMGAWVLAFVGTVLIEAFNPKTHGILKVLAGFRQQLQWVPFFYFGYALIRSKKALRMFMVLVCACAVANAVVATYQTRLSPSQLATWGPGYRALYQPTTLGKSAGHARVYDSEGEARPRPVGLGSDSGFSGGVGQLAFPFSLALLVVWRGRKRWWAVLFALGSLAGVATGLGKTQVVGALLGVLAAAAFAYFGGRQSKRLLTALAVVGLLALPFGALFLTVIKSGTFSRYESLGNSSAAELATHKAGAYTLIPHELSSVPFGVGLGTSGPVSGVGGVVSDQLEGHVVSSETQYNLLANEVGAPGLLAWAAISIAFMLTVIRGIRYIKDRDLALLLAAACGPFAALVITGFTGPFETSSAHGPYFWLAIGIAAYWFAGRKRIHAPLVGMAPFAPAEPVPLPDGPSPMPDSSAPISYPVLAPSDDRPAAPPPIPLPDPVTFAWHEPPAGEQTPEDRDAPIADAEVVSDSEPQPDPEPAPGSERAQETGSATPEPPPLLPPRLTLRRPEQHDAPGRSRDPEPLAPPLPPAGRSPFPPVRPPSPAADEFLPPVDSPDSPQEQSTPPIPPVGEPAASAAPPTPPAWRPPAPAEPPVDEFLPPVRPPLPPPSAEPPSETTAVHEEEEAKPTAKPEPPPPPAYIKWR